MKLILLAALTSICVFSSCNNGKNSTKKPYKKITSLNGTWVLTYINNSQVEALYPGRKPRILFETANKRISGNTGCNSFSFPDPVKLDGSKIDFTGPMILTKMFCPGQGENVFLETIKKVDSWSLTDDTTLNLTMGDTAMMRFTRIQS